MTRKRSPFYCLTLFGPCVGAPVAVFHSCFARIHWCEQNSISLQDLVQDCDDNRDGIITADEFAKHTSDTVENSQALMSIFDINDDGQLDPSETRVRTPAHLGVVVSLRHTLLPNLCRC